MAAIVGTAVLVSIIISGRLPWLSSTCKSSTCKE
jgi:hypothetical protein